MATKTRLKSGNIRVQFRLKNLKLISQTFKLKQEADQYIARIESDLKAIREAEKAKLPIDMAALYRILHPDLKNAVQLLPAFTRVLGEVAGNELTLAALIDQFMRHYEKKDQNIINRLKWWSDHYGHLLLNEITEDHIRHGINTLLRIGTTGKRGISPQSTNRFKANLSSVFEFGRNKYHLKKNPCRQIKGKPESIGRKRYLTEEEQIRFIVAARNSSWDKFYLLVLMAITTGARRGELQKLRWNDVNFTTNQVFCRDTKNGSDKTLPLTEAVITELKRLREVGSGLIFCNPKDSNRAYDFRAEWYATLNEAGIEMIDEKGEKIVFHSLRHTFCSTLANKGAQLQEIATLAGHKSLQTTMRYTHSSCERLSTVINIHFGTLGN